MLIALTQFLSFDFFNPSSHCGMFSIWTKVLLQFYSNYYWILQNLPVHQITKFEGLPMSMTLRQSFMILLSKAAQNRWVKSSFSRKHDCKLIFCYVNTLLNSLSKQLSKWGKSDGLKSMIESWNWFPISNQRMSNQSSLGLISPISPTSPGMDWVTITI